MRHRSESVGILTCTLSGAMYADQTQEAYSSHTLLTLLSAAYHDVCQRDSEKHFFSEGFLRFTQYHPYQALARISMTSIATRCQDKKRSEITASERTFTILTLLYDCSLFPGHIRKSHAFNDRNVFLIRNTNKYTPWSRFR
jgi:hypothetical protein